MVAQNHGALVAQVADQALALIEVQCDSFEIMVGELTVEQHGGLIERQKALLLTRHRDPRYRMQVNDATHIRSGGVNGRVNGETGRVDGDIARFQDVAGQSAAPADRPRAL